MKQIFYHYTLWEDFQNGMYKEDKNERKERVQKAVKLLTNTQQLYFYMREVIKKWKCASEQNLTNPSINHRAFLGQAACNISFGIKEDETREAWGIISSEQRKKANEVADIVFREFYEKNENNEQISIFGEKL